MSDDLSGDMLALSWPNLVDSSLTQGDLSVMNETRDSMGTARRSATANKNICRITDVLRSSRQ